MNFYFKEWLLLLEELKPKSLAFKILGNQVDKTGKPIISNDLNILKTTQDFDKIISNNIPEAHRKYFYPTVAYIYKTNPSVDEKEFSKNLKSFYGFVINRQMPVLSFDDNGNITGNYILDKGKFQGNPYDNYNDWINAINNKSSESQETQEKKIQQKTKIDASDLSDQELIASSNDGKIKVYKANAVDKCIMLGRGKSFCISQPGNSNYAGYRSDPERISTFYFVHDDLTKYKDLSIVVVDATKKGIRITDGPNETAKTMADPYTGKRISSDPELYFKYLRENGIDTNVFVNIGRTQEEQEEEIKFGKNNPDLNWFKNLSYEDKKKYLIRGHSLSDEQFNWLVTHKFESLLKQYLTFGATLSTEQLNIVLNDSNFKDLKLNYLNTRIKQIPNKNLELIEYLAIPKAYKEKSKEKYGYDLKDYINGTLNIEEFLKLPESEKKELKNLLRIELSWYIDLPKDMMKEIEKVFGNNKSFINVDSYLNNNDALRNIFYLFVNDKAKIIEIFYLLSSHSKEMNIQNIPHIIRYMKVYLDNSSKYIFMFRRFFQNFASKIDNGEYFDRWETDNENKPLNHKDIKNYSNNKTLNLFREILKYSFENIDDDAVMTIKFIVDTIGKQKFPRTTRELIKEYVGEQNYKSIFDQSDISTKTSPEASPEQIQQGYTRNSTRESRHYK